MSGLFTDRERKAFSLARWLDQIAENDQGNSLERELLEEAARVRGDDLNLYGVRIPWELLTGKRALTASGTGSQFITETTTAAQALASSGSLVSRLGIPVIDCPPGTVRVPLMPAPVEGQWLADENSGVEVEQPTIGAGRASPKILASLLSYSRAFSTEAVQGPAALESWLLAMVGKSIDRALLHGAGGAAPLGVANTPGIQTGTIETWGDLLALEEAIEAAEGPNGAWVTSPAGKKLLRGRALGDGSPIWKADTIDGTPAVSTPICPDGQMFAGDWSSVHVYMWGGGPKLAVKNNGKSLFSAGMIQMRVIAECDVIALRPERLAVASVA